MTRARIIAPLIAILALSACSAVDLVGPALGAGSLLLGARQSSAPAEPFTKDKLEAAEKRGTELGLSLELAAKNGMIAPSADADTQRPNFCEMVVKNVAYVTDAGGTASALTCGIEAELDQAGYAFEHHDKPLYDSSLGKADSLMDQLAAMIRTANQGAPRQ
jgi:hypothetical protein